MPIPFLDSVDALAGRPLIIAHRGNSVAAPENTLPAFESAVACGADLVELDYVHSADGVPVVFHDRTLDRTTDAVSRWQRSKVAIAEVAWDDLRRLDAGSWFAPEFAGTRLSSLEEVLTTIAPRCRLMIERKAGDAATLVALLRRTETLDRVVVQAFDMPFLARCAGLSPELTLGALGEGAVHRGWLAYVRALGIGVVGWNERDTTQEGIEKIREAGCHAWVWTVDCVVRARELAGLGVEGLITNDPASLRAAFPRGD